MDTRSVSPVRRVDCVVCGTPIFNALSSPNPRKLCSAACRRVRARQLDGRPLVDHPPRPCEHCGQDYKPKSKTSKFCSTACSRAEHKRREHAFLNVCAGCGNQFRGRRLQSFCTHACSAKHNGRHGGRPRADGSQARPARPPRTGRAREYAQAIQGDPCSYCGGPAGEVDHIEPVHRGGADEWENYTAVCRACNTSKMTSPLLAFLLRRRVDGEIAALRDEREVLLSL
jgi:hypothetical protein